MGIGIEPRNCVGMCFAMEEMKMTICAMIQKGRFYPVEETPVPKVFCIVGGHLKSEYCSKFNQIHLLRHYSFFKCQTTEQLSPCKVVRQRQDARQCLIFLRSYTVLYYCSSLKMSDMCYLQRITLTCHLFQ